MKRYHLWVAPAYWVVDRETSKPVAGPMTGAQAEKAMAALEEIEKTQRELEREEERQRLEKVTHGQSADEAQQGGERTDEGGLAGRAGSAHARQESGGTGDDLVADEARPDQDDSAD